MRICYLAAADSIHSYKWVKFFAGRGHDVLWISLAPLRFEPLKNVVYYEMPRFRFPGLTLAHAILKTRRILRDSAPDILHAHYAGTYGLIGALSGVRPFILTAWGSDILLAPKSVIRRPLIKLALKRARLITCGADHMVKAIAGLGIDDKKIKVVLYGIDTQKFRPMGRTNVLAVKYGISGSPVVISLRHLEPTYDVASLVKAIPAVQKRVPKAKFVIAGTGSEEGNLKRLAESLGIMDNVIFIGKYSYDDLPLYLNAADIYVSTSLQDGGFAASTSEAMACEVPAVVTDFGVNRNWIKDGVNGFIVPMRSPSVLAEKIIALLENEGLRKQFGSRGREVISERNDLYKEMEKMEVVYQEFLSDFKYVSM
jgi:glycosyltransferase involved in cell wall biosynthesis